MVTEVSPLFRPGDLLARRYRIVRFIAQGAMGEVYEVQDHELRERLALKTIRPDLAGDVRVVERFRREIQLARKVTHKNVARVFDIGRHEPQSRPGSPRLPAVFFTMELLAGETLEARIARVGRMKPEEALPLAQQMAAALAAAHKAGVVHRDLRPRDVILVPESDGGERAVVTDFGLARGVTEEGHSLSGTGALAMTSKLARRTLEGARMTAKADIYSLGTVLYEMVAGTPIGDAPASSRLRVPGLDPRFERVILRCLGRDTRGRFTRAEDVVRALRREPALARVWRAALVTLVVTGLVLTATVLYRHVRIPTGLSPVASAPVRERARRAVAVVGFKNLSKRPESAWISTALSEMFATELAAGGKLRLIPGENVARMKAELTLPDVESLGEESLGRIRRNLGADLVVSGSYEAPPGAEGALRLELRLQDAVSRKTLSLHRREGEQADLLGIVSDAGAHLRRALGTGALSSAQVRDVHSSLPRSADGARLYAEGLARLRLFDAVGARTALEKAVAADMAFAPAHAALAEALSTLGYDLRAKEEAGRAIDTASGLSREERLAIDGRYQEIARSWGKAVETYRVLFGFFPDHIDYGLRLVMAQVSAGMAKEALAQVRSLQELPPPDGSDPRIDLAEAAAAEALGDFRREVAAAKVATGKGLTQGAKLIVAQAGLRRGWALIQLGDGKGAAGALERAREIFSAAGDRAGEARAINYLGGLLARDGDLAAARKKYDVALVTYREIGNKRGLASALNNLGGVLFDQGDLSGARETFQEALATNRETGNKMGIAITLGNLGEVLSRQGDLEGSQKCSAEALAIDREIGNRRGTATRLLNLGDVLREKGSFLDAMAYYDEASFISRETGQKSSLAYSLYGQGEVLATRGDLNGSRQRHQESLALRKEAGEIPRVWESELALATLALEEGNAAEAERVAREAGREFAKEKAADRQALAQTLLVRALLLPGRLAEARDVQKQAEVLSARSQDVRVRVAVALCAGQVDAARGKRREAKKRFEAARSVAAKSHLERLELEARLLVAELEAGSAGGSAARRQLEALEREASSRGFRLIAQRASGAADRLVARARAGPSPR